MGLLIVAIAIVTGLVPSPAAAGTAASCRELDIPVTSTVVGSTMHATLCTPARRRVDAPLEVLVPGGTYNRSYWSGLGLAPYSYAAQANAAGYATLAVDRIGTGLSSHPLSQYVTGTVQADALHQVITRARTGALDGQHHRRIALVGHSLGSMVSVIAAGAHPDDVDAVILTGYSHTISPTQLDAALAAMHPAAEEGWHLDPGYLTTIPGARAGMFHAPGDVDPAIIAADEATKDVASMTELPDALQAGQSATTTRAITARVLEANGTLDSWACAAVDCTTAATLRAAEQPDFSTPLTTYVQPKAGHCLALAADGGDFAGFATAWLDRVLTAHHGGNGS